MVRRSSVNRQKLGRKSQTIGFDTSPTSSLNVRDHSNSLEAHAIDLHAFKIFSTALRATTTKSVLRIEFAKPQCHSLTRSNREHLNCYSGFAGKERDGLLPKKAAGRDGQV